MKAKRLISLLLISMLFATSVSAQQAKVANITVEETDHTLADNFPSRYIAKKSFLVMDFDATLKDVKNTILTLQSYGVDPYWFAKNGLDIKIANKLVQYTSGTTRVLGHYYGQPSLPEIYLYAYSKEDTLVHEIGHYVDYNYIAPSTRQAYLEMRKLSPTNPDYDMNLDWESRPQEIFAEDFTDAFLDGHYPKHSLKRMTKEEKQKFREMVIADILEHQPTKIEDEYFPLMKLGMMEDAYFIGDTSGKEMYLAGIPTVDEFSTWLNAYGKDFYTKMSMFIGLGTKEVNIKNIQLLAKYMNVNYNGSFTRKDMLDVLLQIDQDAADKFALDTKFDSLTDIDQRMRADLLYQLGLTNTKYDPNQRVNSKIYVSILKKATGKENKGYFKKTVDLDVIDAARYSTYLKGLNGADFFVLEEVGALPKRATAVDIYKDLTWDEAAKQIVISLK